MKLLKYNINILLIAFFVICDSQKSLMLIVFLIVELKRITESLPFNLLRMSKKVIYRLGARVSHPDKDRA